MNRLIEELASAKAKVAFRGEILTQQEDLYIASKEALVLERSEVATLRKSLEKEQVEHGLTRKANIALKEKYCVLENKHKELELQYSTLWESTSHPPKASDTSIPSTSQGCGKCYNIDMNAYSTNLANMEAMKKELAKLNVLLDKKASDSKKPASGKVDQPKRPQYKDGRHPHIKDGLGHIKGGKTNGRKVINGFECVQFRSKGLVDTERSAQSVAQKPTQAAPPPKRGSATVKGGSAAPPPKGKTICSSSAQNKHKKKVYQTKVEPQKPKESIWAVPNKFAHQPKPQAARQSLTSCFVLKNDSKGEVFTKYIGNGRNVYLNTFIWVPKIFVTNMQGPKKDWGPKSRN